MINKLIDYYYNINIGQAYSQEDYEKTKKVIQYLIDCNIDNKTILKVLESQYTNTYMTFEELPDMLWRDSLLNRDTYYIHKELHLNNQSTVVDMINSTVVSSNNAIEMKIVYTYNDLLAYYENQFGISHSLLNEKKELSSLRYIYNLCEDKYSHLNAIDVLLYLIDNAANSSNSPIYNILDIQKYLYETIVHIEAINNELIYNKTNKIIWR